MSSWRVRNANIVAGRHRYSVPKTLMTQDCCAPAQAAIAWVVQQRGVTTVIPGARNSEQARANAEAGRLGRLDPGFLEGVRRIYDEHIRATVHPRW